MAQLVLDPDAKSAQGTWAPTGRVDPHVLEFGYVPNFTDWLPGDVLLFQPKDPTLAQKLIAWALSRSGFRAEHSRWTHAAIYVGDGYLCEGVLTGIKYDLIYKYIGKYNIRVRRLPDISDKDRFRIAIHAMSYMREFYGFRELPTILKWAIFGGVAPARLLTTRRIICSQLCARAYVHAVRLPLQTSSDLVTPADLSINADLQDVILFWKTII